MKRPSEVQPPGVAFFGEIQVSLKASTSAAIDALGMSEKILPHGDDTRGL
jgi:hypothetical protein